jgi:hypothetical protein
MMKMYKRFCWTALSTAALLCISAAMLRLFGCTSTLGTSQMGYTEASDSQPPQWIASYAPQTIGPWDTWRIYLKATDAQAEMAFFNVLVEVPAGPSTPIRMSVPSDETHFLSGYLTLNAREFDATDQELFAGWVRLSVALENRAGQSSPPLVFNLSFVEAAQPTAPPEGVFADKDLGSIPVQQIRPFFPAPGAGPGRELD